VGRDDAVAVFAFNIAAPRPIVWEHFMHPGNRPTWREVGTVQEGLRRSVGAVIHCTHGDHFVVEEITDLAESELCHAHRAPIRHQR
jgi:hypothetical protein